MNFRRTRGTISLLTGVVAGLLLSGSGNPLLREAIPRETCLRETPPQRIERPGVAAIAAREEEAVVQKTAAPEAAGQEKGLLLYENSFSRDSLLKDWVMEGPGKVVCRDGWMEMYSPGEEWNHVFWCPEEFPASFIAEWELQNLHPEAGLLIVFFAARGTAGEDVLDPSLPPRDGTFRQYTKERLNSYHISYYANNPKNPERKLAHLRKNNMFELVQHGPEGIPKQSTAIHRARLIKDGAHILFYIDERKIIDWTDDGKTLGPVYGGGKIGFRQMKWSRFRYRNFKVWSLKK